METHLLSISHAIQLAVAPVFLLTGVGAILNVLSTRLARIIDRHRIVQRRVEELSEQREERASLSPAYREKLLSDDRTEMIVLQTRLKLVYRSITFSVMSALFICLVVAIGFAGALTESDTGRALAACFIASMGFMVLSLLFLLREIHVAVNSDHYNQRP